MANKLKIKRGPASTIPTGELAEPLFTTDTYDLYIGTGSGNQRFQKYIASGTTSQYLRGDGSLATHNLDSLTDVIITSPSNGQILSYNGTNWVNNALSGYVTGGATSAGQVGVWNSTTNIVGYTTFTFDNATDKLSMTNAYVNNNLTVDGQLVIKSESGASAYTRGLKFPDNSYGGTGDTAGLRLYNNGGENIILELYAGNDSLDTINFAVAAGGSTYNDNVTVNGNKIWNAGNLPSPLSSTGTITSGEIAIFSNSTTVYSDTALFWDNSLNRLGVGGNSPNAQVGVTTSSGVNAFGYRTSGALYYELTMSFDNTTYGHLITTGRSGSTTARDLTLLNNTTILALDESNNVGINTLSPVVSATSNSATGLDIYSSSNTVSAGLALHTISSGTTSSDGFRVLMRNDGSVFMINQESGGMIINAGTGNYEIITNAATSFKIDSSTNKVGINNPASIAEALTVNGSIQQSGVTNAVLKANASGKLIAATAGSDYQAPITLTTTGTSGAATFSSNTLNIPQYQAALTNPITGTGTSGYHAKFTGSTTLGNGLIYDGGSRAITIGNSSVNSWGSPFYVIEGGTYGQFLGYQTNAAAVKLGVNAYFNGSNYIYTNSSLGIGILDVTGDATNSSLNYYGATAGTAGSSATLALKFSVNSDASVNIHGGFLGINHSSTPSTLIDARNAGNAITTLKNTTGGTLSYSSIRLTTANSGGVGDSIGEIRGISQNVNNRDIALTFLTTEGSGSQTEKMRITAGGNVGIGVTSLSSWVSTARALQMPTGVSLSTQHNGSLNLISEGYESTANTYSFVESGVYATRINMNPNDGAITFFNTSSTGTAGNAITWSEKMRIDSSAANVVTLRGTQGTQGSYFSSIEFNNSGNVAAAIRPIRYNDETAADLSFWTREYLGSLTQRMTILRNGNVGIGTSSPTNFSGYANLSVNGTNGGIVSLQYNGTDSLRLVSENAISYIYEPRNIPITFSTNATERMRITSGGYSKHSNDGTYYGSTGTYHEFRSTATSSDALVITATDSSYTATAVVSRITRAAGTAFNHFYALSNGVGQFYVRGDGTIFAQNTTVQSASDIRMKENIFNSNDGLNIISALRPVRFDFKEGFGNDRKNQLGFIAQEVEAIFPDIIDIWGESDEKNNPYKSVGATGLIPVLVKAIQEQQQQIEQLKAKLI